MRIISPNKPHSQFQHVEKYIFFYCSILVFVLYELTNAPGLFWGDAGEFMAVSRTLGIGHPYGHPLFWLLGRLSIMIMPGSPAAAMNHLKKWRRLDPQNGEILRDMASLLITRKQYDRATEAYRKGLSLGADTRPSLESRLYQSE